MEGLWSRRAPQGLYLRTEKLQRLQTSYHLRAAIDNYDRGCAATFVKVLVWATDLDNGMGLPRQFCPLHWLTSLPYCIVTLLLPSSRNTHWSSRPHRCLLASSTKTWFESNITNENSHGTSWALLKKAIQVFRAYILLWKKVIIFAGSTVNRERNE